MAARTAAERQLMTLIRESLTIEASKKHPAPSKKAARSFVKGTKTFKQKEKKAKWADDPGAMAAWMQHRATGEWPHRKKR